MTTDNRFHIPDGMVLQKKGGRPKKEARNAAVFIARFWRTNVMGDLTKQADDWIVHHWKSHGGVGITEESSVRRSIRAAVELMTNRYTVMSSGEKGFMSAFPLPVFEGSKGWLWTPGMTDAHSVIVRNLKIETVQETFKRTPVNLAVFHAMK